MKSPYFPPPQDYCVWFSREILKLASEKKYAEITGDFSGLINLTELDITGNPLQEISSLTRDFLLVTGILNDARKSQIRKLKAVENQ